MRRLGVIVALCVLVAGCGSASQTNSATNGPIALTGIADADEAGGIFSVDTSGRLHRLTKSEDGLRQLYPTWSHDGTQFAFLQQSRSLDPQLAQLAVADADGTNLHQVGDVIAAAEHISWSPDDGSLAFVGEDGKLWTVKTDGTGAERVWDGEARGLSWSPDGGAIVVGRFASLGVTSIDVDSGTIDELTHPKQPKGAMVPNSQFNPQWSPDGKQIAFVQKVWLPDPQTLLSPTTIEIMNADGSAQHTLTKVYDESSTDFSWSPDGLSIAFTDNRDDGFGLWVMPSGGGKARVLISSARYALPSWGPAGT